MKKSILFTVMLIAIGASSVVSARGIDGPGEKRIGSRFYLGYGFGINKLTLGNTARVEEGINFDLGGEDSEVDAVTKLSLGWWINKHVGLEISNLDFGEVEQNFTYHDTRNGERGTGKAIVSPQGTAFAFMVGYDLPVNVRWVAHIGLMRWKQNMESRFDIAGGGVSTQKYNLNYGGQSLFYGAGIDWNFSGGWHLKVKTEIFKMDDDELMAGTIMLSYDLIQIYRNFN